MATFQGPTGVVTAYGALAEVYRASFDYAEVTDKPEADKVTDEFEEAAE